MAQPHLEGQGSGTGIGVAVTVMAADVVNEAIIDGTLSTTGLNLEAGMLDVSGNTEHKLELQSTSGANGGNNDFAGSVAIGVNTITSRALIGGTGGRECELSQCGHQSRVQFHKHRESPAERRCRGQEPWFRDFPLRSMLSDVQTIASVENGASLGGTKQLCVQGQQLDDHGSVNQRQNHRSPGWLERRSRILRRSRNPR